MSEPVSSRRRPPPKRAYDASGRRDEARARRRSVVEVARRLFLERGYAETSVAEIARVAGVSPQTVYGSFDGKAGLLAAVVYQSAGGDDDEVALIDRPDVQAMAEPADPAERVAHAARLSREINERVGALLHLVESVSGADPAVGRLHAEVVANMRADARAVTDGAFAGLGGPDRAEVAEQIRLVGGHRPWQALVVEGGWSPERYEAWVRDAMSWVLLGRA